MPKKAKAKRSAAFRSPAVSDSQNQRRPSPIKKRSQSTAAQQPASDSAVGWTIHVGQTEAVLSIAPATVVGPSSIGPVRDGAARGDTSSPRSAWMAFGSERSYPTDDDLVEWCGRVTWDAGKAVEVGDTFFFYFTSPRKAIHFIARVTSEPVLGEPFSTNPGGARRRWADCDSMVRIAPIELTDIQKIFREAHYLPFVKGVRYIRPDLANSLLERAKVTFSFSTQCAKSALQRVMGRRELGDPTSISLAELRELPSAGFRCEEEVEYHVVEPLLRLARVESPNVKLTRRHDLRVRMTARRSIRKTADYAVFSADSVVCIIETKLDLTKGSNNHVKQAGEYALACRAPAFVLMDRDRVFCYRTGADAQVANLDRKTLDEGGLRKLRLHILGSGAAGRSMYSRR